ncbi:Z1 domain-containing protein [Bacillus sp. 1780r2a1]|nr:Z1 domain-containing protein [Bacillus sp. 1780r2a1]
MNNDRTLHNKKRNADDIVTKMFDKRILKTIETERKKFIERSKNTEETDMVEVGKISTPFKTIVTDGNHTNHFRTLLQSKNILSDDLLQKAAEVVENVVDWRELTGERIGLLFGRIQSGKTNSLIASLAMAADNGYKCFIVLTSDNLWLYQQTISRLRQSLPGITIAGKEDWENNHHSIKTKLQLNGVVFVSTKNVTNLKKLNETILNTKAYVKPAIIFDDEADQASLNTNISKEDDDPSKINALVSELRKTFRVRTYIQVTATPQALFLQGLNSLYRPTFTVLIEPGQGYVGGEKFFANANSEYLLIVPNTEIDMLTSVTPILPEGLKYSICWFYIGATIQLLKSEGTNFSFLCHVSLKKIHHENVRAVIQHYTDQMAKSLCVDEINSETELTMYLLYKAYDEISMRASKTPSFDEVINKLKFVISSTDIQVLNTDRSRGEPRYDNIYNILIGGTKLGRGVTIEKLLVTYYGRQTKNPQIDTVLQHARMYGYRSRDLYVSRVFLPQHLADRFRVIYESENNLRDVINKHRSEGLRSIWLSEGIKPTRANVLDPNEIGAFAAGSAYFPHKPLYKKTDVATSTQKLNQLLEGYVGDAYKEVPLKFISSLLKYTKTDKNSPGLWSEERILLALDKLQELHTSAFLSVKINRKLSPSDDLRNVYTSADLNTIPNRKPTLLMLRQNGDKWDNQAFWIPVFRFPEGNYAFMFNATI